MSGSSIVGVAGLHARLRGGLWDGGCCLVALRRHTSRCRTSAASPGVAAQTRDSHPPVGDTNVIAPTTAPNHVTAAADQASAADRMSSPPTAGTSRPAGEMWPSPTAGEPLALRYLPDGLPCLVIWHPAAMYACAGHDKLCVLGGPTLRRSRALGKS